MRQASWWGWASIRSHLPRWAGAPLLVAVVIMASLGWVILARGTSPADGTVTFPSAPYWSERGVVINDVVSGVSGLRVGDCVVAVDGRPLDDLVRNGPDRIYGVGHVIRYDVRRSDGPLDRDCSGPLVTIEVSLNPYQFGPVLREHASVLLLACFMLALGAFLVAVRPRSGAPRALLAAGCLYLFGRTVWPFGIQIVDLASGPRLWPFVIGDTANALFWGALLLMAASLPRQNLPPRRLAIGCLLVPLALHLLDIVVALREPSELGELARLITVSSGAGYAIPILMVLALVFGYRSVGQPEKRAAVRWVLIPFTLGTFAYYGLGQLPAAITGHPLIPWIWFRGLFILILAAMTVSVVRNHMFEVQIVIRRWGLRIVALLAGVAGVLALWRLLIMSQKRPSDWLTAAAGILIAALCLTIAVLNRVLQRRLFGARADSDVMIAALSPQRTPVVTDESGLIAALDALRDALRLAFVNLDVTMPGMTPLSLFRGASRAADRVIPLYAGKVHVGQLSLAVRPGLEPLGRADERLLDALSHVLASSAYNLGLQQALRRALAQAVTAREEERRRIRREIHDGIGPLLAAALLRTESAMVLAPGGPSQTESLQKLHDLQKTALTDVRSLVEGLRPPALDHGDLLSALQQHAELSAGMAAPNSPKVSFEVAGGIAELPAAVEVAAYRIAQEAISNATKHACARRITVRLSRTDQGLEVEIDDDGIGVTTDNGHSGVGLASMTERATELGGWCTNDHSSGGGTRVKAWLPILTEEAPANAEPGRPNGYTTATAAPSNL
jgi:two-component system, NarL family, sensor kinase